MGRREEGGGCVWMGERTLGASSMVSLWIVAGREQAAVWLGHRPLCGGGIRTQGLACLLGLVHVLSGSPKPRY